MAPYFKNGFAMLRIARYFILMAVMVFLRGLPSPLKADKGEVAQIIADARKEDVAHLLHCGMSRQQVQAALREEPFSFEFSGFPDTGRANLPAFYPEAKVAVLFWKDGRAVKIMPARVVDYNGKSPAPMIIEINWDEKSTQRVNVPLLRFPADPLALLQRGMTEGEVNCLLNEEPSYLCGFPIYDDVDPKTFLPGRYLFGTLEITYRKGRVASIEGPNAWRTQRR